MIKLLKLFKFQLLKFYYLRGHFLSKNTKKKNYYKYVEDGYENLLFSDLKINEKSIVFDVGGFKGEFTDEIQKYCDCNIYVFEPVKEYFDLIVEKQKSNRKVHVYNIGLGGCAMNARINKTGSSSSMFIEANNEKEYHDIKIESITEFILSNNISKIDLIKINIEGGEYDLLDSLLCESTLMKSFHTLLIQFHDFFPDAVQRRKIIKEKLSLTHNTVFDYPFIWEKWVISKDNKSK